jgi:hypothetical protein
MADDGVRAAVDAATMSLVVELSPSALTDLIAAAVEAYVAPARGRGPIEMYATAFGSTTIGAFDEKHERHVHTYVTRFALHHHAKATASTVVPSTRAEAVHRLVAKELFNDGSVLVGEAHSHPVRSWSTLIRDRAWTYSEQDQDHCRGWQSANIKRGERAFFSIVIAVSNAKLSGPAIVRSTRNRYRVRLANRIGLVVACYRVQLDGDLDGRVDLGIAA